jgi:hypothetical protein
MNLNFFTCSGVAFILLACNANNTTKKKDPVIVELPAKNISDSSGKLAPAGSYSYDLKTPNHTWKLPSQLIEVSGNTWVDKDHLILIEDLHPDLYFIKIDDKNATLEKTIPFAEQEKEKVDI